VPWKIANGFVMVSDETFTKYISSVVSCMRPCNSRTRCDLDRHLFNPNM
jgi:hypothetical protein